MSQFVNSDEMMNRGSRDTFNDVENISMSMLMLTAQNHFRIAFAS